MGYFSNLIRTVSGLSPDGTGNVDLSSTYSPVAYATFVRRVRQTLTDKTSFSSSSAEQWGSEFATLDDALLPKLTSVTVHASLQGYANHFNTNVYLYTRIDISLDGGSTWDTGRQLESLDLNASTYNSFNLSGAQHQVTGTVTGDIKARAMVTCSAAASTVYDCLQGAIYMEVLVSP